MAEVDEKLMSEAEALDWLAEVFQLPRAAITADTPRRDIPSWDSLGVLTLMAELDDKFELVLSDQEMQAMKKIGDVIALLRTHGKLGA